jgi:hypothetical protein
MSWPSSLLENTDEEGKTQKHQSCEFATSINTLVLPLIYHRHIAKPFFLHIKSRMVQTVWPLQITQGQRGAQEWNKSGVFQIDTVAVPQVKQANAEL